MTKKTDRAAKTPSATDPAAIAGASPDASTGAPEPAATLHPQSNSEPEPGTDLRQALRAVLIETIFPAYAKSN